MAGLVEVDGRRVDKPGTAVAEAVEVAVEGPAEPFASRAGRKLDAALDHYAAAHPELDPRGWTCLDVGASTGGFTDCLLQRGAARVYAIDVGYGQLDFHLRRDPRVVVMERVNARHLQPGDLPQRCRLAVVDVSFISLAKVVPALVPHVEEGGFLLPLIKPQFEAGREHLKKGIVRDARVHEDVCARIADRVAGLGWTVVGIIPSPIEGGDGNREFLLGARRD
jgi:23S rRNA (cytidine1920-2'-O)/16S rRNA (cytidine1409-2'-O)-methyltransferase